MTILTSALPGVELTVERAPWAGPLLTPWGPAQASEEVAPGILDVYTGSHGGFLVSRTRNAQVHQAWRDEAGAYEEDCAWRIIVVTFPQFFAESLVDHSHDMLRAYFPAQYAQAMGVAVTEEGAAGKCGECGWEVFTFKGRTWALCDNPHNRCNGSIALHNTERTHKPL